MALFGRSVFRVFAGRYYSRDGERSCFFFMGALQVGFAIRWMLFPQSINEMRGTELHLWAALYVLSTLLAVWVLLIAKLNGRGQRDECS